MTRTDKQNYKRKVIMSRKLGYFFIGLAFVTFISLLFTQLGVNDMAILGRIISGICLISVALVFVFLIREIIYSGHLRLYRVMLNKKRTEHNFKIVLGLIENGEFVKSVDIINSIPDPDARIFLFYKTLFLGLNSTDPEVAKRHRQYIDNKIKEYTS